MNEAERQVYNYRPPIDQETEWTAVQLRVVYQLIKIEYGRNPLMAEAPNHYLSQLNFSLQYIPAMGMFCFWLVAIRGREPGVSVLSSFLSMYARASRGLTFRAVAFPGYKATRQYTPRGRGHRK